MSSKNNNYWEQYAEKFGKVYALRHLYFLGPALMNFLGDIQGKTVVDLGCGTGINSALCKDKGAQVVGVDISKEMLKIAWRSYSGIDFIYGDAQELDKHIPKPVDIVFASQVFLTIQNRKKIQTIFKQVASILKPTGKFIFTDAHFFRRDMMYDDFLALNFPKKFSYFKSGKLYDVILKSPNSTVTMHFKDTFWNLTDYLSFIKAGGFVIEDIYEPKPVQGIPMQYKKYFQHYFENPLYIFFKLKKI